MKEKFTDIRLQAKARDMIAAANTILREYHVQGFTMTLRQLHYQFVARGLYDNTVKNYKNLGKVMSDGRLAGLVDWAMMEDRLREVERCTRWDSPSEIIAAVADQYQEDPWRDQAWRPEVWIEKDALAGVIDGVCKELRIDYFACRGYVSQSAQYQASKRFTRHARKGQEPVVFHFGDHDPSGLDMTRENRAKFQLLTGQSIKVVRLALNMDQVRQYNPPPNPAKLTDTRASEYVREFGDESWELDALEPNVMADLVRNAVGSLINQKRWDAAMAEEKDNKQRLLDVSDKWDDIVDSL